MYLCICVSMYLCICVSMYLCICVSMYLCICVSLYTCSASYLLSNKSRILYKKLLTSDSTDSLPYNYIKTCTQTMLSIHPFPCHVHVHVYTFIVLSCYVHVYICCASWFLIDTSPRPPNNTCSSCQDVRHHHDYSDMLIASCS